MNLSEIYFPSSLQELFQVQNDISSMCVVAGGTTFGILQSTRFLSFPSAIVSLSRIPDLHTVHKTERIISIGAACPLAELQDVFGIIHSRIHSLLDSIATPAIRNMATIGGHLMYDRSFLTLWPLLASLDAELELRMKGGIEKMSMWQLAELRKHDKSQINPLLLRIRIPLQAIDFLYHKSAGICPFPYGNGITLVCAASFGRKSISQFRLTIAGRSVFRDAEIEQRIISASYPFSSKFVQTVLRLYKESLQKCGWLDADIVLLCIEEALEALR
ncbi:MAG: FAD binding domain-containing protein [Rectinema sp.]|nr:FAD binding domain-containing protein [Rectinema sp.]